jgi:hypothetical protein
MARKRERVPEKITCGNPAHGVPLRHEFIADHSHVELSEVDRTVPAYHSYSVGEPHGAFICPACNHYTIRHAYADPAKPDPLTPQIDESPRR